MTDEALLLDLLNTPDADAAAGRRWLADHDQPVSDQEWRALAEVRTALRDTVRGTARTASLARFVAAVNYRAELTGDGLTWILDLPAGRSAAARVVLAWDALVATAPGRLRPCANPECELFLIDHSRANNARWCSMAVCGNRMKARRHYRRTRAA